MIAFCAWGGLTLLIKAAAVAVCVVWGVLAWNWTKQALLDEAATRPLAPVSGRTVELQDVPDWIDQSVRTRLKTQLAGLLDGPQIDHGPLQRATDKLRLEPWVKRVLQVQRSRSGVLVRAEYRRPAVFLSHGGVLYQVDEERVQLPGRGRPRESDDLALPIIVGADSGPPGMGLVWPGEDVKAGLGLASLLASQPYADQIRHIDVSHRDGQGRLKLAMFTDQGRIDWGLPPGHGQPIEPDSQTKLLRLAKIYRECGSIDAAGRIVRVNGPVIFVESSHRREPRAAYAPRNPDALPRNQDPRERKIEAGYNVPH